MVVTAKEARRYGIELVEYLYPLRDLPKGIDPEPRWCSASSARKRLLGHRRQLRRRARLMQLCPPPPSSGQEGKG